MENQHELCHIRSARTQLLGTIIPRNACTKEKVSFKIRFEGSVRVDRSQI